MENARKIIFFIVSYTLPVAQSNFILLINQWYLESQKPIVILMSKKNKIEVF